MTPEATRDVLDREAPGIAQALRADSIAKTPHGLLSRGVAGVVGRTLVVNLRARPEAAATGSRSSDRRWRMRSSSSPTTRPSTSRRDGQFHARAAAGALRAPREDRAHGLRAAVRLCRRLPRRRRGAERARPALDHARHGRRPLARDGAQPADRRGDRRAQPADRGARAAERPALRRQVVVFCLASLALFLVAVWQLDPIVRWLWPIPVSGSSSTRT